jgi:hypothetical protein
VNTLHLDKHEEQEYIAERGAQRRADVRLVHAQHKREVARADLCARGVELKTGRALRIFEQRERHTLEALRVQPRGPMSAATPRVQREWRRAQQACPCAHEPARAYERVRMQVRGLCGSRREECAALERRERAKVIRVR